MKKRLLMLTLSTILFLSTISVSAAETDIKLSYSTISDNTIYMSAESKQLFAKKMNKVYEDALETNEAEPISEEIVEQLMVEIAFSTGAEKDALLEQLEMYGIYQYNETPDIELYSTSSDVSLKTPTIFYSASANTWTVACQGNWKNNNWNVGVSGNIGGTDGFGVAYTNTSSYNTYVVGCSAYIADQNGGNMVTTSHRSDGNGAQGFGFELQDYCTGSLYVGYKWYGSCTYSSNFANFSGTATAYYAHTYSTAYIQSVTFTSSSNPGVNITIANRENSFKTYSSDKTF